MASGVTELKVFASRDADADDADAGGGRRAAGAGAAGGGSGRGGGHGEPAVSGAPVISEARAPFAKRRWLSTALGGLRLSLSEPAPWHVYILQLLLFAGAVVLPIVMSLLSFTAGARYAVAAAGGLVLCAVTQTVSGRIQSANALANGLPSAAAAAGGRSAAGGGGKAAALVDEEEFAFDADAPGCAQCDDTLCRFLVPSKPNTVVLLVHAVLIAAVSAGAAYYLDADHLNTRYGSAGGGVLAAFGWIAVATALHPLLSRAPPELLQYSQSELGAAVAAATRSAYVLLLVLLDIIAREVNSDLQSDALLATANTAGHVVFALLPVLAACGALAPPDALALWAVEQAHVSLFGGSHAATDGRLLVQFAIGAAAVFVVFGVNAGLSDGTAVVGSSSASSAVVFIAAALGFAAAHNLLPNAAPAESPASASANTTKGPAAADQNAGDELARYERRLAGACYFCPASAPADGNDSVTSAGVLSGRGDAVIGVAVTAALIAVGLGLHFAGVQLSDKVASLHDARTGGTATGSTTTVTWAVASIVAWLVLELLVRVQRPVCCGVCRNRCFHAAHKSSGAVSGAAYGWVGIVRAFLMVLTAVHLTPAYGPLKGVADVVGDSTLADGSAPWDESHAMALAHKLLFSLCAVRAFRRIWQHTSSAALEVALLQVIDWSQTVSGSSGTSGTSGWLNAGVTGPSVFGGAGGWGVRLLLCGLFVSRAKDLLQKCEYMAVHTVTAFTNPKLRIANSTALAVACVLLFPVHLAVLAASVALAVPVIPVFGLPLFALSAPRPHRLWSTFAGIGTGVLPSGADATSNGLAFYRHMLPSLLSRVAQMTRGGMLTDTGSGDVVLLRVEPYLVWLYVLEAGAGYQMVAVKGLELMTTSCHTAEANAIDECVDYATAATSSAVAPISGGQWAAAGGRQPRANANNANADESGSTTCISPYAWHSFQPVGITHVRQFTVTKTSLTGIIDVPDNLQAISTAFMRVLTVLLYNAAPNGRLDALPSKWLNVAGVSAGGEGSAAATAPSAEQQQQQPVVARSGLGSAGGGGGSSSGTASLKAAVRAPAPMAMGGASMFGGASSSSSSAGSSSLFSRPPPVMGSLFATSTNVSLPFATPSPAVPLLSRNALFHSDPNSGSSTNTSSVSLFAPSSNTTGALSSSIIAPPPARPLVGFGGSGFGGSGGAVVSAYDLNAVRDKFPAKVLELLLLKSGKAGQQPSAQVMEQFRSLVLSCYAIVETLGTVGPKGALTSEHVAQVFSGRIGHSSALSWLKGDNNSGRHDGLLHDTVLRAYRYAVKLVYDRAVMMELDELTSDAHAHTLIAAVAALVDGDKSGGSNEENRGGWHVGPANDAVWNQIVSRADGRALFAIAKAEGGGNQYTSLTLRIAERARMAVGRLNGAAVRAIWAATALELLYFANDDDERYSIQTHPKLLRNLCVQTAEPPLGYPVFGSLPLLVTL